MVILLVAKDPEIWVWEVNFGDVEVVSCDIHCDPASLSRLAFEHIDTVMINGNDFETKGIKAFLTKLKKVKRILGCTDTWLITGITKKQNFMSRFLQYPFVHINVQRNCSMTQSEYDMWLDGNSMEPLRAKKSKIL